MIIKDLHIENYRLFEDFHMEGLAQVNLIAGKNNTGKTALLEALRIWASRGDTTVVNNILKNRGDYTPGWPESYETLRSRFNLYSSEFDGMVLPYFIINDLTLTKDSNKYYFDYNFISKSDPLNASVSPDFPNDKLVFIPFSNNDFPIKQLWERIALTDDEADVLRILQIIDKEIGRIDMLESGAKVKLRNNSKPIPLKNLGEGLN